MILYRKAAAQDAQILSRLREDMLKEEPEADEPLISRVGENTRHYLEEGLTAGNMVFWLATEGDEPVAMGGAVFLTLSPSPHCPEGKTAYIGNMYVRPEYRLRGVAARILSILLEEAKNRGCQRILLHATEQGRPLYEKYGFEPSATAMAYYPPPAQPAELPAESE